MKKRTGIFIALVVLISASSAMAAERGTPEYERLKEYKKAQREGKGTPGAASGKKAPGFWEKEGERSGLGSTGSNVGNFFRNLNPAPFFKNQEERYQQRKTATVK